MKKVLADFRDLKLTKEDLKHAIGNDLHNIDCPRPLTVHLSHVIFALRSFIEKRISVDQLVNWVNVVWFTELFQFRDAETDSIISVLEVLETWDEGDAVISLDVCEKMVAALSENNIFTGV